MPKDIPGGNEKNTPTKQTNKMSSRQREKFDKVNDEAQKRGETVRLSNRAIQSKKRRVTFS